MDKSVILEATRAWIASFVVGLNLCPFARRVMDEGRIRYKVSEAIGEEALLEDLARELQALGDASNSDVETTLLIHPQVLGDFLGFNDFLGVADQLIEDLGLRGVVQLASFHPNYQFEGTLPDDVENYTNRSPYPMLHLLLEKSITSVAGNPEELLEIPRRNIETLKRLGIEQVLKRLEATKRSHPSSP